MRWTVFVIIAFVCVILQTTLLRTVEITGFQGRPVLLDLLLILGLFIALNCRPFETVITAWFLGFATDLYSAAGQLGLAAILFAVVLGAISYVRGEILKNRILTQFLIALAVVFLVHLGRYMVLYWMGESSAAFWLAARMSFLDGVYAAILAPYVFWMLGRLRTPLRIPART